MRGFFRLYGFFESQTSAILVLGGVAFFCEANQGKKYEELVISGSISAQK